MFMPGFNYNNAKMSFFFFPWRAKNILRKICNVQQIHGIVLPRLNMCIIIQAVFKNNGPGELDYMVKFILSTFLGY
jgi:hypothetical protein